MVRNSWPVVRGSVVTGNDVRRTAYYVRMDVVAVISSSEFARTVRNRRFKRTLTVCVMLVTDSETGAARFLLASGHAGFHVVEPIRDDDDRRARTRTYCGIRVPNHQESLAIGGNVEHPERIPLEVGVICSVE